MSFPPVHLENGSKNVWMEQELFQKDLAKMIRVDEMIIVNWEKGYTKPAQHKAGN